MPLGRSEIESEPHAWGVNFRDIFTALGRLNADDFGVDTAGYVTEVGTDCGKFKP